MDKSDVFFGVESSIKEILNASKLNRAEMIGILESVKHDVLHLANGEGERIYG